MKNKLNILPLVAALMIIGTVISTSGQTMQPQSAPQAPGPFGGDPIRQLNLTPEQREQIRLIREQTGEERATINQRVRDTNHALAEVLDSDNPDEGVIDQRMREVAAAQAAAMRMRILSELKIRRVLTQEQRILLRGLRQQANEGRAGRRLETLDRRQNRQDERSLRLREQRKNVGPLFPGRNRQRKPIL